MPFLPLIEVFGIFLPLAFHAIYGVAIAFTGRSNAGRYPYARNWFYIAQRVTGIVALAFIAFHLWEYRIQKWLFGMPPEAFYGTLSERLSSTRAGVPWVAFGYTVGLAASVFHFANGLWGFSVSWGIAITQRAQRRVGLMCAAFGVALFLTGFETVLHFATGAAVLLPNAEEPRAAPESPCPKDGGDPTTL
jgi:succinate dehydrogenase/fumarate reductase cytochrome b subunit (b558 family)